MAKPRPTQSKMFLMFAQAVKPQVKSQPNSFFIDAVPEEWRIMTGQYLPCQVLRKRLTFDIRGGTWFA